MILIEERKTILAQMELLWCPSIVELTVAKNEEAERNRGRIEDADQLQPEGKGARRCQIEIPRGRVQILVLVKFLDQYLLRI